MRIVILDGATVDPGDNPWDDLAALGTLTVHDRTPPEEVVERARGAEIVLTNKTRLPAPVIEALEGLRFVAVLATGYDVVDIDAARGRGIPVSNVPEYGTAAVAQHTFALLLELTNRVGRHADEVRSGAWESCPDFSFWRVAPLELAGKSLGIVGHGRIGRRVADIGEAFGMRILVATRRPGEVTARKVVGLDDLFARADVVSLHCPATPETIGLVGAERLARMKPGALLVNTARGTLVDEAALRAALESGRIGGAAVDVLSSEPPGEGNPLIGAPRCLVTPHMAWAALDARRRLMTVTVRNVEAFLAGRPQNVVNP